MAAVMQSKAERPEEAALTYPFPRIPEPGETIEVAPGVRWLRMKLPFALDHINLWLLADTIDGVPCWSAVDCGVGLKPTRDAWETIFVTGLEGRPIKRVIITHAHPDHIGNADWLCGRFADHGCRLTATAGEYLWGRVIQSGMSGFDNDAQVEHFRRHGLSDAMCEEIRENRKSYFATLVPSVPLTFDRMRAGDTLTIGGRAWQAKTAAGRHPHVFTLDSDSAPASIHRGLSGDRLDLASLHSPARCGSGRCRPDDSLWHRPLRGRGACLPAQG